MRRFADFMQRYGVVIAFIALFAISAIWKPDIFLKPENLRNLLNQSAPVGMVAVGMTLVIIAGGIDLSVGSMLALAAASGMWAMNKAIPGQAETSAVGLAVFVTLATGAALGALNGVMVVVGRIAPFIATLVGLVAYRSLCVALAEGSEIRSQSPRVFESLGEGGIPLPFLTVGKDQPLLLPWAVLLFIFCALVAGFLLNRTRFGRYAVAVGANEKAARYSAVPVGRVKFLTYVLLGFFTGLAAITLSTRMNSVASSTIGQFYELDAIAAVVIGGTSLAGGSGRVWGTVVGVLLLAVIGNMLVVAGVSPYWQGVVKGAIILIAVLMQRGKG